MTKIIDDETRLESHFQFGENWSNLVLQIDRRKLEAAVADVRSFIGDGLEGKDFLESDAAAAFRRWRLITSVRGP